MDWAEDDPGWGDGPEGRDPDFGADACAATWAVVDAKAIGPRGLAEVLSPALVPSNDPAKAEQS